MASGVSAAQSAHESQLLRISKATKSTLALYAEGVHIVAFTARSITDLQQQACADRLDLANSFLTAGERLTRMRPPEYRSAISRFYYSMYHATRAVVYYVHGGDDHESHSKLPTQLPRDFSDSAVWTNDLKDARSRRNEADYDPYPMANSFWRPVAIDLSHKAPNLLALARQYLIMKGCAHV